MDFSIVLSFMPDDFFAHFDVVGFKELGDLPAKKDCYYIYLNEINTVFGVFNSNDFKS